MNNQNLVKRVVPTLMPIADAEEIPQAPQTLTNEEVRRGFQQIFPGVSTEGVTRMQMLIAMGRHNIEILKHHSSPSVEGDSGNTIAG